VTVADPYSVSRIGRGVAFLVGGKALTSIAGIGTLLLLVRGLPVEQFAAYAVLYALVELVDVITGVGLIHVLARYVPELYVGHQPVALRRLVVRILMLRFTVLATFLGGIFMIVTQLSPLIGLAGWEWAVMAYLPVVLFRIVAMTLFNVLESMLHQAVAQLGFGLVTVLRFALLAAMATQGPLDLQTVIVVELITDVIGVAVMLGGMVRVLPRGNPAAAAREAGWLRANLARVAEFGLKGYLQNLLIVPYGHSTNRLLVGGALPSGDVALFGFAVSIADLMERYLPVRLLAGVIRPVLTARYVRERRFSDLQLAANMIFKVNAVVICAAAVVIFGGGERMLASITGSKYSEGGTALLLLMCAFILLSSLRHMLDLVSHAVERNGPLIWSNATIMWSVLPGIALLPTLGVFALPTANLVGMIVGCAVLVWRLHAAGFSYRHDLGGLARILVATALGLGGSEVGNWLGAGWLACAILGLVTFAAAVSMLRPWTPEERQVLADLARRLRQKRPDVVAAPRAGPP
jgi:O-antigen/teichoic acid export membrane protein